MRSQPLELLESLINKSHKELRKELALHTAVPQKQLKDVPKARLITSILQRKYEITELVGADEYEAGHELPDFRTEKKGKKK